MNGGTQCKIIYKSHLNQFFLGKMSIFFAFLAAAILSFFSHFLEIFVNYEFVFFIVKYVGILEFVFWVHCQH